MQNITKNKTSILVGLLAVLSLFYPSFRVQAYWSLDRNGNMIYTKLSPGQILGEEDKKEEEKKKEEQKTNEQKQESRKEEGSSDRKEESSNRADASTKEQENHTGEDKADSKEQLEVKSEEIETVEIKKVENEDEKDTHASGEGKMEVILKKNNKEEIKGRQDSFEMETEDGDKVHVELSPEKTQMEIRKNGVTASIDLPISVNPTLKRLMLKTPNGEVPIESLPDDVLGGLVKDKQIDGKSEVQIDIKYEDGQVVYKIRETKHKKIVGIIPIDLVKDMSVQDGTRAILSMQESFLTRLLSVLSF